MNTENKSTEANNTDKKLHISDVRKGSRQLISFLTWYSSKTGNDMTGEYKLKLVEEYLKEINCF